MEVIEKMEDSQYEAICDAGVALVQELTSVLKRYGLAREQAFNVLVVAAAGISAASELTSVELAEGVDSVIHMWRIADVNGDRQAIFDPAHLRPDFVPPLIDMMASN